MRARTVLLCGLVACARAQTPGDLLGRVSKKVMDTVDRLPKYMCTQTIDRFQYEPVHNRAGSGCETDPNRQLHLSSSDRLRLDVAVSGYREMYSWVAESHFEDRSLFDLVGSGALSTGSFSSFLVVVFKTDETAFSYRGPVTESGRQLEAFDFRVPKEMSHYVYGGGGVHVTTGYYGTILVDPKTDDLVRLEVHTDRLPAETGSCNSNSILDYSRMRLHDTDFLLPNRSELNILDANGVELKNVTVYSGCHEFLGESVLSFDSAADAASAASKTSGSSGDLPAGASFRVAFSRSVDPATAAAGDKITGRLTGPIRDERHQIVAPKGAAVTLRILEIRRFYNPVPVLRVVVKPETLEIGGGERVLSATPEMQPPQPPPMAGGRRGPYARVSVPTTRVLLDNQDPQAAVLLFSNIGPNFVVPSSFESDWVTAARRP
jgi:hypothetical protein